jgi:anti-sigma factor RsiW
VRCEELLRWINDYVDGTLEPGLCRELEGHLAGCDPCTVVIDNIRRTITLYRGDEAVELPPGLRERLRGALAARWRELHASSEAGPAAPDAPGSGAPGSGGAGPPEEAGGGTGSGPAEGDRPG